jgi:hypothetical protein
LSGALLSYKIFLSHLITQKVENSPVNPDQKTADANRFRIIKLVYPPRNNSLLLASTTSSSADQHRSANRAPPERRATKSKIWNGYSIRRQSSTQLVVNISFRLFRAAA